MYGETLLVNPIRLNIHSLQFQVLYRCDQTKFTLRACRLQSSGHVRPIGKAVWDTPAAPRSLPVGPESLFLNLPGNHKAPPPSTSSTGSRRRRTGSRKVPPTIKVARRYGTHAAAVSAPRVFLHLTWTAAARADHWPGLRHQSHVFAHNPSCSNSIHPMNDTVSAAISGHGPYPFHLGTAMFNRIAAIVQHPCRHEAS